jgi:hypothetical protein
MYPPPTTRRFSGTLGKSRASVESQRWGESMGQPGMVVGAEPVAMMA